MQCSKFSMSSVVLLLYWDLGLKFKFFHFEFGQFSFFSDNFVIIYELFDEMMDFGFPQTTESKILQE